MAVVWTTMLLGGLGVAAFGVSRYGFRQPAGWPRALGAVVLGWAWLSLGMEALGAIGFLALGPLLGWVGLGLAFALGCRLFVRPEADEGSQPKERASGLGWEGVAAVGLVVWAAVTFGVSGLVLPVKVVSDGPIYHLYFAARWWKAQSLELIATPFGENGATYFPAVGDLWFTALMIAWGGDRLAKIGQAPFLLVAGLTSYALCRRFGAGRPASALAACWSVASSPLMLFSFEANVDTLFVAGYLLAVYFFARYAIGDDGWPSLVLGALAAGSALGTKATGVVFVPPLLLLGMLSALVRGSGMRAKAAGAATIAFMPLSVAGFWYARNAILTGNPLYPLHLTIFGRVVLAGWYGPDVMRRSPYYLPVSDLSALGDILLSVLDPRLAPLWLAALFGAWALPRFASAAPDGQAPARPARMLDVWVWSFAALSVLNVTIYWLAIPYRTQQRFMLHALGLAAVPLARSFERFRWLRAVGALLLILHILTPQTWPFSAVGKEPPWDLNALIPNAVPGLISMPVEGGRLRQVLSDSSALSLILSLAIGMGSLATARFWSLAIAASTRKTRAKAAVSATVLVVATGAAMYPWGVHARLLFFPPFRDYYVGWLTLDERCVPAGSRIAYSGTDLPYYLMGVGLRNDVRYINIDSHPGWLLHDYHRAALRDGSGPATWDHPRPGWDRAHPDERAWLSNLSAEGIRWLVVTRANPEEGPHNVADSEGFPIERRWADSHPERFELVHGPADGDRLFRLYRARTPKPSNPP